jgi:hypothetical protein
MQQQALAMARDGMEDRDYDEIAHRTALPRRARWKLAENRRMSADLSPVTTGRMWAPRTAPLAHQVRGSARIVALSEPEAGRVLPGCFFLADEMGAGKTKQVIDAAYALALAGTIDTVVVVAPAPVRAVWWDPELGQILEHGWEGVPIVVEHYHATARRWTLGWPARCLCGEPFVSPAHRPGNGSAGHTPYALKWIITNYDFMRRASRLARLLLACGHRTMLVLDEAGAIKNHRALQTKACSALRRRCGRVVLLDGTPVENSPLDLYSKFNIMDPRILGYRNFFHFRADCAIMGGYQGKQILGWKPESLERVKRKTAPYVLRRLKSDCMDLPEKLPPVVVEVPLSDSTWPTYVEMKKEQVVWLEENVHAPAAQAGVRVMRLALIASGFLTGIRTTRFSCPVCGYDAVLDGTKLCATCGRRWPDAKEDPKEISSEKADAAIAWAADRLKENPKEKLLFWCRFRLEGARLAHALATEFPSLRVGRIVGGQTEEERSTAVRLLDPAAHEPGPCAVVGSPQAGALGINLADCAHVLYLSNDYSLKTRLQSIDRVHRPGQTRRPWYGDLAAVGPSGQRTVDHLILAALARKTDLSTWTTKDWVEALSRD